MSEHHRISQELARRQKREKRLIDEIERDYDAFRRALVVAKVPKVEFLKWVIAEGYVLEQATRIIATGHGPDEITVTVTFD